MQKFVAEQNIRHFREMLASETDEQRRESLRRLIAEEEAKLQQEIAARKDKP